MTELHIDTLEVPGGGRIGLCPCPGARHPRDPAANPSELIARDIATLRAWGASGLVSLIEQHEFEILTVTALPMEIRGTGLWWQHLPIRDMYPPGERFEQRWVEQGPALRELLRGGGAFAMHCWAGLGRTGTVAARLLVELGTAPADAVRAVRAARAGSIQTEIQEQHVHDCTPAAD